MSTMQASMHYHVCDDFGTAASYTTSRGALAELFAQAAHCTYEIDARFSVHMREFDPMNDRPQELVFLRFEHVRGGVTDEAGYDDPDGHYGLHLIAYTTLHPDEAGYESAMDAPCPVWSVAFDDGSWIETTSSADAAALMFLRECVDTESGYTPNLGISQSGGLLHSDNASAVEVAQDACIDTCFRDVEGQSQESVIRCLEQCGADVHRVMHDPYAEEDALAAQDACHDDLIAGDPCGYSDPCEHACLTQTRGDWSMCMLACEQDRCADTCLEQNPPTPETLDSCMEHCLGTPEIHAQETPTDPEIPSYTIDELFATAIPCVNTNEPIMLDDMTASLNGHEFDGFDMEWRCACGNVMEVDADECGECGAENPFLGLYV